MSTSTVQLEDSVEVAEEQDNLAESQVTLCSEPEVTDTDPVPCSPAPPMENPNPNG